MVPQPAVLGELLFLFGKVEVNDFTLRFAFQRLQEACRLRWRLSIASNNEINLYLGMGIVALKRDILIE